MTTKSKALVAGVAIMLTGAVIGWGASHMMSGQSGSIPETPAMATVQQRSALDGEKLSGDLTPRTSYQPAPRRPVVHRVARVSGIRIPAGTPVAVVLHTTLSSKTASVGDAWSGTLAEPIFKNGREVVPAGSLVHGIVAVARPAERGDRATLQLALSSITVNGRRVAVSGSTPAVVAGSPRARNVGAIAGGTAAGALIGKAIGQSGKSTLIGAIVGGGAATAAVAASKGYQASIAAGQEVQFTTASTMTVRA